MKTVSSLYLHFPFCAHLCNYCDFYKTKDSDSRSYEEYYSFLKSSLIELIRLKDQLKYKTSSLETVFIGGGTPSLWAQNSKDSRGRDILDECIGAFHLDQNSTIKEFTVECNPDSLTPMTLKFWTDLGANRFSLGIQTLNPELLKLLDRVHSIEESYVALKTLKDSKLNYSFDLMLGLPDSERVDRDIEGELEELLKHNPNHISLYILKVGEGYPYRDRLPSDEWIEKEYLKVSEYLKNAGFNHYEISNFAKPGFESLHNLKYWQSESVLAIGPSATGLFSEAGLRYKWKVNRPEYIKEELSDSEQLLEKVYLYLRINQFEKIEELIEDKKAFATIKASWVRKGYLEGDALSAKGFLMMDSLMDDLFKANLV
ncbi:MAG: coproporphyrinogen-III oxidase family protein [Bacteriovoracaceae bacterium]